jgi:hypothetical protein
MKVNWKIISAFLLVSAVSFLYGNLSRKHRLFPYPQIKAVYAVYLNWRENSGSSFGKWDVAKKIDRMSGEQKQQLSSLSGLPYLNGSNPAGNEQNVTIYDKNRTCDGLNFYVSGHKPYACLMDMEGKVLHEWSVRYQDVWPQPYQVDEPKVHMTFWRRARLFPNGDLLAIYSGYGLIKIDKDSNLIWAYQERVHHDLDIAENGYIYTLVTQTRTTCKELKLTGPIMEDCIVVLDPDGKEHVRFSILDAFLTSDYASFITNFLQPEGDAFHTNTLEILDGRVASRIPMFKKGHLLVSMRSFDTIAVIDPNTQKVTWAMTGMWKMQHQPTVLDNGNVLLFDNQGYHSMSQVMEFNPLTQEIVWAYRGNEETKFFSRTSGSNQRLANGNTLITETDFGRAFEVTPNRDIVWEFYNPYRTGVKMELVANLFELIRVKPGECAFLDKH